MQNIFQEIFVIFATFDYVDLIDILLVAVIIYGVLYLMRGTQAIQLLRGMIVLVIVIAILSDQFQLTAFSWFIQQIQTPLLLAIPVIFQPEIRRGLERLGRTGLFLRSVATESELTRTINQVCRASKRLSDVKHGALIVFERNTSLEDLIHTGVLIDSAISPQILVNIFYKNAPLHDGAVIIRDTRVAAATVVLPLSSDLRDHRLGTRHRAAVGVTEKTDAIVVVVSEETGTISLAYSGRLIRYLDEGRLNRLLHAFYGPSKEGGFRGWWSRFGPDDPSEGV
ncbi:MAG: diadenylate cyclase CdaA [Ardenticatenaceae bacterium]